MLTRGQACLVAVLLSVVCLDGCSKSNKPNRDAEAKARVAAEVSALEELKQGMSAEEFEKISTVDDGRERLPDRVVLRRIHQAKAKSKEEAQAPAQ